MVAVPPIERMRRMTSLGVGLAAQEVPSCRAPEVARGRCE